MEARKRSLHSIFDPSSRFVAPLFQRPYVWNREKNWQPLWDSLHELLEQRTNGASTHPYFLGAIVVDQVRTSTGDVDTRELIDGQQRLTTLQLLITAIRDICAAASNQQYHKVFSKWTSNDLSLSVDPNEVFKVWPTNLDRKDFRTVMTAEDPRVIITHYGVKLAARAAKGRAVEVGISDDPDVQMVIDKRYVWSEDERTMETSKLTRVQQIEAAAHLKALEQIHSLIPKAYLYFYSVIADWLGASKAEGFVERLNILHRTLRDDLVIVVIDLDEKDDAQQIFETMNALGTPLLPADLVKNYLFRSAEIAGGNIEELYQTYWKEFDAQQEWRKLVRQGRLNRPKLDLFLRHYLSLMIGEEVPATDLFSTYRMWAHQQERNAVELMRSLYEYAQVYAQFDRFPPQSPVGTFFYRLEQLDTTTVYPFLLELFKQRENGMPDIVLEEILNDVESFLVRRAVCGLTAKNYNRQFLDLIQRLNQQGKYTHETVRSFLLESRGDSVRWPDDEEFREAWQGKQLYLTLVRKRLRMILEALETRLHSDKTEQVLREKLTIEHLMPQRWEDHWPLESEMSDDEARIKRSMLLHTIGNLTLLTKSLNPAVSNGPWDKKLSEILSHSALNLNRPLPLHWSEQTIVDRSEELFDVAKRVWPFR